MSGKDKDNQLSSNHPQKPSQTTRDMAVGAAKPPRGQAYDFTKSPTYLNEKEEGAQATPRPLLKKRIPTPPKPAHKDTAMPSANKMVIDKLAANKAVEIQSITQATMPEPISEASLKPSDETKGLWAISLYKSYKKRPILKDVSLHVQRGEAVALLGPNGAGKTTSFYIISGLVDADDGHIFIDGADVTGLPMYRRARMGIGYLPQEPSIFRGLNVQENIMAVLEVLEADKAKRQEKLQILMEEFSIGHLQDAPAVTLSGGERRRLEIARALASEPEFILLDEPLAGIDPIAVKDIRALVGQLKERGIGVLITDHNVRDTMQLVDRAYILHDGEVLFEGTPQDIINNPDVKRVYLGDSFDQSL